MKTRMRNGKGPRVAAVAFCLLWLGFATAVAQPSFHVNPRLTWMQTVTILGNEGRPDFGGRGPFSAVEVSKYYHRTGAHRLEARSSVTTYIDCDRFGRTRAERLVTSYNDGKEQTWVASVYIADPVAGFLYRLDEKDHTALRWAWDVASREAAVDRDRRSNDTPANDTSAAEQSLEAQVRSDYLGISEKEGLSSEGWKQTLTVPAGAIGNERAYQIVVESWISRKLNVAVFTRRDTGATLRETRLTKFVSAEPDTALFRIPPGYKIEDALAPDSPVRMTAP